MGKIVLLESSDIGARYSAEAIKGLGHEPVFLCELEKYQGDPLAQIQEYRHLNCPTTDTQAVLKAILGLGLSDLIGLTSLVDSRLSTASEAAALLGIAGLDPAVITLKDKGKVASLTPEFSPPSVVFQQSTIPLTEIEALLTFFPKIMIKPTRGAGGLGAFTVEDAAQLKSLAALIGEKQVPPHMSAGGWIAEAFISGELASLEGYVLQGAIRSLGFTSRRKVGTTESAATFPVDRKLTEYQRARALSAVEVLMSRSGYLNGYFHIEFIFTSDSCFLIDANVGRLGGGPLGELLALSYGVDPIAIFKHAIEVSLFGIQSRNPYDENLLRAETHAILYGLKAGGELLDVDFPAEARCYHTQILSRGAKVTPMGTDDWSWIGIVSGLNADTVSAVEKLRIHTPEGVFEACY
ncbi:MAG: ATP-grasp domain-containing protein [Methylotenera sp.]|nr:ATP-grasp domain-containing protein [Oligoflexia bacterium]